MSIWFPCHYLKRKGYSLTLLDQKVKSERHYKPITVSQMQSNNYLLSTQIPNIILQRVY